MEQAGRITLTYRCVISQSHSDLFSTLHYTLQHKDVKPELLMV